MPQLVLIDLVSGDTKVVDTDFDVAKVASALDRSLAQLIEDIESQHALRVGLDRVMLCHYAESNPAWRKYLFLDEVVEPMQKAG